MEMNQMNQMKKGLGAGSSLAETDPEFTGRFDSFVLDEVANEQAAAHEK